MAPIYIVCMIAALPLCSSDRLTDVVRLKYKNFLPATNQSMIVVHNNKEVDASISIQEIFHNIDGNSVPTFETDGSDVWRTQEFIFNRYRLEPTQQFVYVLNPSRFDRSIRVCVDASCHVVEDHASTWAKIPFDAVESRHAFLCRGKLSMTELSKAETRSTKCPRIYMERDQTNVQVFPMNSL